MSLNMRLPMHLMNRHEPCPMPGRRAARASLRSTCESCSAPSPWGPPWAPAAHTHGLAIISCQQEQGWSVGACITLTLPCHHMYLAVEKSMTDIAVGAKLRQPSSRFINNMAILIQHDSSTVVSWRSISSDCMRGAHRREALLGEGLGLELLLAHLEALHLRLNQLARVGERPLVLDIGVGDPSLRRATTRVYTTPGPMPTLVRVPVPILTALSTIDGVIRLRRDARENSNSHARASKGAPSAAAHG